MLVQWRAARGRNRYLVRQQRVGRHGAGSAGENFPSLRVVHRLPFGALFAPRGSWCALRMDDEEIPWALDEGLPDVDDVCPLEERLPAGERVNDVRWAGVVFELREGPPFQP